MAQVEGMLECERSWLEGVMAEKGLLEALSNRPPDNPEPQAGGKQTGALSLPDRECRRHKWWLSQLTQSWQRRRRAGTSPLGDPEGRAGSEAGGCQCPSWWALGCAWG